jgi:hypothetical protein
VIAADFNGNGMLDLAVANSGSNTVSVLLGNGNGTFQVKRDYPVSNDPESLAVADLNGDGKLDLVTADAGADEVSILIGNGNGTFQMHRDFAAGPSPRP